MATVYFMIGIPGSGKSTYANKFAEENNCNVHSSDAIRKEFFNDQQHLSDDKIVWRTLKERVKTDLLNGKDCIIDATNISVKKRRQYFEYLRGVSCKKVALLMKTSFKESVNRNMKRPKEQVVPYYSICNLQKAFQEPTLDEGFDEIIEIN